MRLKGVQSRKGSWFVRVAFCLHGMPARYRDDQEFSIGLNWTEGCIAVTNKAMEEIWTLVADNSPIEILP